MMNHFTISPLGDAALIINFENVVSEEINKKVFRLFYSVKNISIPGVKDVVPAYSSLAIHYNVVEVKHKDAANRTAYDIIKEQVQKIIEDNIQIDLPPSRTIKVPVCYAEKYGLDINDIAIEKNISVEEIIQMHIAKSYRVYMIGFLPGFAYLGEVDERIAITRKAQPRIKIEAGSVGIAGKQTGIYPFTSPGGWQIIGKTPLQIFNKEKDDPTLFHPGDEVEFYSISEDEFANY